MSNTVTVTHTVVASQLEGTNINRMASAKQLAKLLETSWKIMQPGVHIVINVVEDVDGPIVCETSVKCAIPVETLAQSMLMQFDSFRRITTEATHLWHVAAEVAS